MLLWGRSAVHSALLQHFNKASDLVLRLAHTLSGNQNNACANNQQAAQHIEDRGADATGFRQRGTGFVHNIRAECIRRRSRANRNSHVRVIGAVLIVGSGDLEMYRLRQQVVAGGGFCLIQIVVTASSSPLITGLPASTT